MDNGRKRVLVPIVGQGSIQHIIRTGILKGMRSFCDPIIGMQWDQQDLVQELVDDGFEVYRLPAYKMDNAYESLKYKINNWYLNFSLRTPGFELEKQFRVAYGNFKQSLVSVWHKRYMMALLSLSPSIVNKWLKLEEDMMLKSNTYKQFEQWLEEHGIDSIFTVTPFLSEVNLLARVLKDKGNKVVASVHSFDNVTKRGWQKTVFDNYIVWNNYNKQELLRVYGKELAPQNIHIAGAPQFDFHFNAGYLFDKQDWLDSFGIPANKKIILYAGGAGAFFPMEVQYALYIKGMIEKGELQDTVLLVRHHPLDKPERWLQHIGKSDVAFFETPQQGKQKLDHTNVSVNDIKGLMSTLCYSDVHISFCSTITVDGSAFGRPQIGVYFDESEPDKQQVLRNIYKQEHFLPIINNDGISLVHDRNEFKQMLQDMLASPEHYIGKTENCLREIITYTDGKSTERVSGILKNFFA